MTDAQLWWLALEFLMLAIIVGGGGHLRARYIARKFDREWRDHQTRSEYRTVAATRTP